jgi:hypothetical protein
MSVIRSLTLSFALFARLAAGAALAADSGPNSPAPTVPTAPPADSAPASPAPPAAVVPAQPVTSLMFTPEEVQAIDKAIADHLHPPAEMVEAKSQAAAADAALAELRKPHQPNIYVSAVVDFGGGDWTVWANGLKVTPDRQSPLFQVVAVNGDTVDIVPRAQPGTHVRLQPNQTWRSRQGDVVEGIVP